MTSSSGAPHLTTDVISDLLEGLLPPAEAHAATYHLERCEQCAAARDAIVRVRDLLGDAGHVSPTIPPALADRIEDGLRSGVTTGPTRSTARSGPPRAPGAHARKRQHPWRSRILAAAAALAVLGAGGTVLYQLMTSSDDSPQAAPNGEDKPRSGGTYAGFAGDVRALVDEGIQPRSTEQGAAAPDPLADLDNDVADCVSNVLTEADAGRVLAAEDHDNYILAVATSTEPDSVHGYAIAGCPGDSARIAHDGTVPTQ